MLDRKFIVENADAVKKNCAQRGVEVDVDRFVALDNQRRTLQTEVEQLNRQANETSGKIGKATPEEREVLKEQGRKLRAQKDAGQKRLDEMAVELREIQCLIPNMTHPDSPVGGEDDAAELRFGKAPRREFDFTPLDHVDLAEKLDLIDLAAGAHVTGSGFYFLKNEAVLLELALARYALDLLMPAGYTPVITPDLARNDIIEGVGFIPRGPERQIYNIADTDLSLIATAEITLGGMYAEKTIPADELPLRYCGISHCFRTEAGAAGRATRGVYRVHQFTKIEMFAFTLPEQSDAMHQELLDLECRIFDGLGLHYRVIDTATGDLGGPAYRKFDLEAWMPGRGDGGAYGEITSTSNCTDYQARRLDIRSNAKGQKGTQVVHTLNGTAVAVSRALVAILENYQQADGSVDVPEALRPYMGVDKIGPKG